MHYCFSIFWTTIIYSHLPIYFFILLSLCFLYDNCSNTLCIISRPNAFCCPLCFALITFWSFLFFELQTGSFSHLTFATLAKNIGKNVIYEKHKGLVWCLEGPIWHSKNKKDQNITKAKHKERNDTFDHFLIYWLLPHPASIVADYLSQILSHLFHYHQSFYSANCCYHLWNYHAVYFASAFIVV